MRILTLVGVASIAAAAGAAHGQAFVNGDFETGSLDPWQVRNTTNGLGAPGAVAMIDIDGPGPLDASQAAMFGVGQAVFMSGAQEGVEMGQELTLTAAVMYTVDFDWSAQRLGANNNAEGGVFSLIVDGTAIVTQSAGTTSSSMPHYGHIQGSFTPTSGGTHVVGVRITRPFQVPGDVFQYVDNFVLSGGTAPCYANCDNSTTAPILNVNDFICFQTQFAAGTSYANCDNSTTPPVLNVNDFICFQTQFAAGCP
jgi:hypothetical protein